MRKVLVPFLLLFSISISFAQNEITNDFLQSLKSKKSISFSVKQNVYGAGSCTRSFIIRLLIVPEDTVTGAWYNFSDNDFIAVYNGDEFLEYSAGSYGKNVVNIFSKKKNPKKFTDRKIDAGDRSFIAPSEVKSFIALEDSPMGIADELKCYERTKYKVLTDTAINERSCRRILYTISDTVINGERQLKTFLAAFDKTTDMPLYTYFSDPIQQRESYYSDYSFDNVDKKLFTRKAFPGKLKLVENAPIIKKQRAFPLGMPVPGFTLKNMNGKEISLTELKGKAVLLDFSFVGCNGCELAVPDLNKIIKKYKDVVVLGIYPRDNKETLKKYIAEKKVKYDILPDSKETADKYTIMSYPSLFLLDKESKLCWQHKGWNVGTLDKVEKEIEKVLKK